MDQQTPYKDHRIQGPSGDTHLAPQDSHKPSESPRSKSRHRFLGNVRGAAMAAAGVGAFGLKPLLGAEHSLEHGADHDGSSRESRRAQESAEIRIAAANAERKIPILPHATNGDEQRYADKCGTDT